MSDLDCESLTVHQFWLAGLCALQGHPRILHGRGEKRTAANLARLGWGDVEDGASGEMIFRLNQAGEDAFAAMDELPSPPTDSLPVGGNDSSFLHNSEIAGA